jgi:hypothetical protein
MIWKILYLIALFGYPAAFVLGKFKQYKVEQGWSEIWVFALGFGLLQIFAVFVMLLLIYWYD